MENRLFILSLNFFRKACCPSFSGVGTLSTLQKCPLCPLKGTMVLSWVSLERNLEKGCGRRGSHGHTNGPDLKVYLPHENQLNTKCPEVHVAAACPGHGSVMIVQAAFMEAKEEWQPSHKTPMLWGCCGCPCPKRMSSEPFLDFLQATELNHQRAWIWREASNVDVIEWCQLSSWLESRPAHFHGILAFLDFGNHWLYKYIQH